MKRILFILMISGVLASCHKDDFGVELAEQDYLIFGEFYGECAGENCVSIFKLTAEELFEDVLHVYSILKGWRCEKLEHGQTQNGCAKLFV